MDSAAPTPPYRNKKSHKWRRKIRTSAPLPHTRIATLATLPPSDLPTSSTHPRPLAPPPPHIERAHPPLFLPFVPPPPPQTYSPGGPVVGRGQSQCGPVMPMRNPTSALVLEPRPPEQEHAARAPEHAARVPDARAEEREEKVSEAHNPEDLRALADLRARVGTLELAVDDLRGRVHVLEQRLMNILTSQFDAESAGLRPRTRAAAESPYDNDGVSPHPLLAGGICRPESAPPSPPGDVHSPPSKRARTDPNEQSESTPPCAPDVNNSAEPRPSAQPPQPPNIASASAAVPESHIPPPDVRPPHGPVSQSAPEKCPVPEKPSSAPVATTEPTPPSAHTSSEPVRPPSEKPKARGDPGPTPATNKGASVTPTKVRLPRPNTRAPPPATHARGPRDVAVHSPLHFRWSVRITSGRASMTTKQMFLVRDMIAVLDSGTGSHGSHGRSTTAASAAGPGAGAPRTTFRRCFVFGCHHTAANDVASYLRTRLTNAKIKSPMQNEFLVPVGQEMKVEVFAGAKSRSDAPPAQSRQWSVDMGAFLVHSFNSTYQTLANRRAKVGELNFFEKFSERNYKDVSRRSAVSLGLHQTQEGLYLRFAEISID